MIRTQISLEEHEYELAKLRAAALGISLAELLRRALRDALPSSGEGPWMQFAGLVSSGNPSSGDSVDDVVYGTKE